VGKKILEQTPRLIEHIKQVVEPNSDADSKLTSSRVYMRSSVNGVSDELVERFNVDFARPRVRRC